MGLPDAWAAVAGSWPTEVAVLTRWPDLRALASARRSTLVAVVAAHTRDVPDVHARANRIRAAAAGWSQFWQGHLDLDALAWETGEHLHDITIAAEQIGRAATHAHHYWAALYGDDPLLLSLPGMGPMTAPTIRPFLGDASTFATAKATASYVALAPSTDPDADLELRQAMNVACPLWCIPRILVGRPDLRGPGRPSRRTWRNGAQG
ncbi:MAG: transposase [Ornithinibacter sp.]